MGNSDSQVKQFTKNMSRVHAQNPINEAEFLYLCKEAVDLVRIEWDDREIIANRITHIWHRHSDQLSDRAKYIGGLFADLEVPDNFVEQSPKSKSVIDLWNELDKTVMLAIHDFQTKHN